VAADDGRDGQPDVFAETSVSPEEFRAVLAEVDQAEFVQLVRQAGLKPTEVADLLTGGQDTDEDDDGRREDKTARYWLTPSQFRRLQQHAQEPSTMDHPMSDEPRTGWNHLALRDEMMIQLMYDMGLRRAEVAALKVHHLRLDDDEEADVNEPHIYLPAELQKKPGKGRARSPARMRFSDFLETEQKLRIYLNARWKESDALFPTQKGDQIKPRSVARRVDKIAERSDVQPYSHDGEKVASERITPHVFRHSVAYRMLIVEEGNDIWDVKRRLRHRSVQTTERIYEHFLMR